MSRNTAAARAVLEESRPSPFYKDGTAELEGSANAADAANGQFSINPLPAAAVKSPAEDTAGEQGDAPGHTEIAEVAYQLWLDRNRGHGSDVEDWYLAIELIRRRSMK